MRFWIGLFAASATAVVALQCDRVESPPAVVQPEPVPTVYQCGEPDQSWTPSAVIPVVDHRLTLDRSSCVINAAASGGFDLGSWGLRVLARSGDLCTFQFHHEIEGGYRTELCAWTIEPPRRITFPKPSDPELRIGPDVTDCVLIRQGSLFKEQHEQGLAAKARGYDASTTIPGTGFAVSIHRLEQRSRNEGDWLPTKRIAPGTELRVGYQLFADRERTQPSRVAGAKNELVFRYGAGEVGRGIEHVLAIRPGGGKATMHRAVAQGLVERLTLAPKTQICVELTVLEMTPPSTPFTGPVACEPDEEWACQVGPTSLDNASQARGCGCVRSVCPDRLYRWTSLVSGAWPDGARKLHHDCVDNEERIRRYHPRR